jgi:hypothetical protein
MRLARTISLTLLLLLPQLALAVSPWEAEKPTAWQVRDSKFEISLKSGGSVYTQSENTLTINARVEALYMMSKDTALGLEGLSMITGNEDYQLLGAYFIMRAFIVNRDDLRIWLKSGFGGGPGPPALNKDGVTRHDIEGLVQLGAGLSFAPWNHRVALGVELVEENLTMFSLLATLGFRL